MTTKRARQPEAISAAAPDADGVVMLAGEGGEVLRIQLDQFEGPFDVLLYLIRQQELDIFNIPIVKVTEQYLGFLERLQEDNLDIAGEFIVMAATLIQIKARMILPVEGQTEEEEPLEEEDPRLELVEKLLEYRRYRDLAQALGKLEEAREGWFGRLVKPQVEVVEDEEETIDAGLYDMTKAIRSVLRFVFAPPAHAVLGEGSSIEEKIELIEQWLEREASVAWSDLRGASRGKIELVCCLLAILELCRMHRIRVHQHAPYEEIRLFAAAAAGDVPAE